MTEWLVALALCRALDTSGSIAVFKAGGREMVPWLPEKTKWVVTVQIGAGVGQAVLLRKLDKQGHPKLARTLAGIAAGTGCAVGVNNWRIAR